MNFILIDDSGSIGEQKRITFHDLNKIDYISSNKLNIKVNEHIDKLY